MAKKKTAAEKSAELFAKYGITPTVTPSSPPAPLELHDDPPVLVVAPSPPPSPIAPTPKKKRGRPKKENTPPPPDGESEFVLFLRKILSPDRKYEIIKHLVVQFKTKEICDAFIKLHGGEYKIDGFEHTVRILDDEGTKTDFLTNAKSMNSLYQYTHTEKREIYDQN